MGRVVDVRLVVGTDRPALTVQGVLVSPHTGGTFLGYERSRVRAPAPIARYLRWRHRGTFLLLWEDIARIDHGDVRARVDCVRYDPVQ